MGIWDRITGWLAGGDDRAPDVGKMSDAQLGRLWKERDELTDAARSAVEKECRARGLPLRGIAPKRDGGAPSASGPVRPEASGSVVDLRADVGVLLQTTPGRWLLVLMPRWNVEAPPMPTGLAVDALVVCNHERAGWLDASAWARALGIAGENVYATADGAIDRAPGAESGTAQRFPDGIERGSLTLRRLPAPDGVLRATWSGALTTATLGPAMPAAVASAQPASFAYVGTLAAPTGELGWSALLAAAHAGATMAMLQPGPRAQGPSVLLLGDAVGAPLRSHTHLTPGLGVQCVGVECPVMPGGVALLGAIDRRRWELVRASETAIGDAEDVLEHLVLEGRTDDATRLADALAAARPGDAVAQRLLATMHALRGALDEALVALGSAEADPFSLVVASAVHLARSDLSAAESSARRALEAMPRDTDAMAALVRALWWAGRADEARALVDDAPGFTLRGSEAADLYDLIARPAPAERPTRVVLPHLAKRAIRIARATSDRARAEAAAARAAELDPPAFAGG